MHSGSPYQRINMDNIIQQSNSVNVGEREFDIKNFVKDYSNKKNNYIQAESVPNLLNNLDDVSSHAPSSVGDNFKADLKKKLESLKQLNKDIQKLGGIGPSNVGSPEWKKQI